MAELIPNLFLVLLYFFLYWCFQTRNKLNLNFAPLHFLIDYEDGFVSFELGHWFYSLFSIGFSVFIGFLSSFIPEYLQACVQVPGYAIKLATRKLVVSTMTITFHSIG